MRETLWGIAAFCRNDAYPFVSAGHLSCVFFAPLFRACEQAAGYSPARMSSAFGSSFISLRGAPDALTTWARCRFATDQRLLLTTTPSA
jgi:hypothetical protein